MNSKKQHDKAMREFQKEYEKTKADAWEKTRKFEIRAHKKAALGILVFAVLFGIFLAAQVSSGYAEKVLRRWKAGRNYEKTCLQETLSLSEENIAELDGMTSARICKLLREEYGTE